MEKIHGKSKRKYQRSAALFSEGNLVQCNLCPHFCRLKINQIGICKNRQNVDGKLFTLAYGNLCALYSDPIEKKPLYHFLPSSRAFSIATGGCNLSCKNCQNSSISQVGAVELRSQIISPEKIIELALQNNCKSIAYTYTEPIVFYEYVLSTAKIAHQSGLKNVLISNGYINRQPLLELCQFIDAANINLKSFDAETHRKLTGARLQPILDTLKLLKHEGIWLEIINLIVPTFSDDLTVIQQMCRWLVENGFDENPLHFSRFHPSYQLQHLAPTPVSTLENAYQIAKREGLKFVYLGNIPDQNTNNTYCHQCNALLIERMAFEVKMNQMNVEFCPNCQTKIAGFWL